jgi:hypothetical protein
MFAFELVSFVLLLNNVSEIGRWNAQANGAALGSNRRRAIPNEGLDLLRQSVQYTVVRPPWAYCIHRDTALRNGHGEVPDEDSSAAFAEPMPTHDCNPPVRLPSA